MGLAFYGHRIGTPRPNDHTVDTDDLQMLVELASALNLRISGLE
jgi:hypothetical protein